MIPITNVIQDSFQEYKGEISLVLFCSGCNLDCKYCYNKIEAKDKSKIKGDVYGALNEFLRPHHTAVVLLGGEFTIYDKDELRELLKYIRSTGRKVKLYTNGQEPEKMEGLYKYLDAISLDIKTTVSDVTGIEASEYLRKVLLTLEAIKNNFKGELEIRTTLFKGITKDDIQNIQIIAASAGVGVILQPVITLKD